MIMDYVTSSVLDSFQIVLAYELVAHLEAIIMLKGKVQVLFSANKIAIDSIVAPVGSLLLRFFMVSYLVVFCHMVRLDLVWLNLMVNLVLLLLVMVLWLMVVNIMLVGVGWTELPAIYCHTLAKE